MEAVFLCYYSMMNLGGRIVYHNRKKGGGPSSRGMELRTDVTDWIGGIPTSLQLQQK